MAGSKRRAGYPEASTISSAEARAQLVRFLTNARSIDGVTAGTLLARFRVPRRFAASALLEEQLRRSGR